MIAGLGDWGFALMDQALPNQIFSALGPRPHARPLPGSGVGAGTRVTGRRGRPVTRWSLGRTYVGVLHESTP